VALATLPLAIWLDELTLAQLIAVAFVDGTGFVFFTLAEDAALPNVVTKKQLPTAIAQQEARTRGASLAGEPVGGALFGAASFLPFLVDAVTYVASLASLSLIRSPFQGRVERERQPVLREIVGGVAWLWRQRFLRLAALLAGGTNLLFQALMLVTIVLAKERGASPAEIGVIMGTVGGAGFLGSFLATRMQRALSPQSVLIGVNWLWALLLPLFLVDVDPLVLGAVFGLMAFVGPTWNVVVGTYELTLVPNDQFGRVRAVSMLIAFGAIPLGSLVGGFLLEYSGTSTTTIVLAAGMAAMALAATASADVRNPPPLQHEPAR
jgi:predicted MFS family arabinose efflux permease